ncbi:MAG: hypothetical protein ABSF98_07865 [Bryobacteraceae bacterium]|jgi:hypothetical protein
MSQEQESTKEPALAEPKQVATTGDSSEDARAPQVLPPEAEQALQKVIEAGGPKALLAVVTAFSRTSTFGPDPATAKVLAEVEMHAEQSRLKGYEATLKNRDEQNKRDDGFRRKRLNHETAIQLVVLVAALAGVTVGIYLYVHGKDLAGYILLASFILLTNAVGGKISMPRPPQS